MITYSDLDASRVRVYKMLHNLCGSCETPAGTRLVVLFFFNKQG